MKKTYAYLILFVVIFNIKVKSQVATILEADSELFDNTFNNPVLLSHYTIDELKQLKLDDSLKFKTINYYYTKSFIIEKIDCNNCLQQDIKSFDVSKYEYLREKQKRRMRVFSKYGFKLTLLSIDELEYKLPIHQDKKKSTDLENE